MPELRIATRQSPLALWQAEHVQTALMSAHPELTVSLVPMTTEGDRILGQPLAKIGGKGLFVKELEVAMHEGRADIAVHSMKDVPAQMPDGFALPVILARENPYDALVSNQYASIDHLPQGAVVGTSSLRRRCQLQAARPDLVVNDLRGNVGTRLGKLDAGDYDAIILASAGLIRLGLQERIQQQISAELSLPAVGQGAIGIEIREGDTITLEYLQVLQDAPTWRRVSAERALNFRLGANCTAPVAAFAEYVGNELQLRGRVGSVEGGPLLAAHASTTEQTADALTALGETVADMLLQQGAADLIAAAAQ